MYTNKSSNPLMITASKEFRQGTATDGEGVANEYAAVPYEPGVGSIYLSSSGSIFYHQKAGDDASAWDKLVQGATEPNKKTFNVYTHLSVLKTRLMDYNKTKATSIGVGASIIISADKYEVRAATATLTPTIEIRANKPEIRNASFSTSATISIIINRYKTLSVGATLTPEVTTA